MTSAVYSRWMVVAVAGLTMAGAAHAGLIGMSSTVLTPLTSQAMTFLAGADPVFTFTDIGVTVTASGTLNATSNGDGTFTAISGSGIFNGIAITLIPNPTPPGQVLSPSGAFNFDDQLLPASDPLLLNGGLLFSLASGPATELNIFSNGPGSYSTDTNVGATAGLGSSVATDFALMTPEPASLVLFGAGFAVLCMFRRRLRLN
jgi:hypothetical protein